MNNTDLTKLPFTPRALKKEIMLGLTLSTLSSASFAQTTLIKNVQGYTHTGQEVAQFKAVLFTDDKIDQVFSTSDSLPTAADITVIDGQGKTLIPGHRGLLLHSEADLTALMLQAMQAGFQVNTHAIGDNANVQVIDNYERLIKQTKTKALRHRVEHAQVLRLSDIPRFNELGIIASMQATHATSDKNMAEYRLGSQRIKGAYAWRSLLDAKAIVAAGSDFPVEYPNPFFGLHASVTRQDKQNMPENGWYKEQAMTMAEAFKSFTIDAAYAGHQEAQLGSITKNKKADFILLDQNIFNIDPQKIWQTQILQTWVNGVRVDTLKAN